MRGSVFKRCACSKAELTSPTGRKLTCKKKHGSWWFNVPANDPMTGKTRQVTQGGFATREEAQRALSELVVQINAGVWTDDRGITVGVWLDQWLERKASAGLRFSTLKVYRQHVEHYLKPSLGNKRLKDLRPGHVADMIDLLLKTEGATGRALSTTTVTRIHACLRSALSTAVKMRLISYNPAKDVELPKAQRARVKPWQPHELGAFLDHVQTDRLGPVFEVIAFSGMRRGEALGLRWEDVDLVTGTITVVQQLTEKGGQRIDCYACGRVHKGLSFGPAKTDAGDHRKIELDQYTAGILLQQQISQANEQAEFGRAYTNHGLVFAREDGAPIRPSQLVRDFQRLTDETRVPADPTDPSKGLIPLRRVRLHDLRHGSASLMLAAGVDMNVISKRLGHSRSSFTADTYAHMLEGVGREAAERASALVPRRTRAQSNLNESL